VRRLPRSAAMALGRSAGRLLGDLDARHARIAREALRRSFPDWDEARLWRSCRDVYAHFGGVLFEVLWLAGRPCSEILAPCEFVGVEHYERALARGKGIVFPTGHVGSWEMTGLAHGCRVGGFDVVARPLDNPLLDARLETIRSQGGNTVVSKRRALARILETLRRGGGVGILIDQNVQEKDGVFVDFFGRAANTTTVAAALAVKTGCAIVPGHTRLRPDGRYVVYYDAPIEWTASGNRHADILQLTQRMTTVIEGWVREAPEQWLWMHRRWHTQPRATGSPESREP
jgi:KDO2-lipid IV(A) lauroyltransferase